MNSGFAEIINSTVSGNESGFGLNDANFAGAISNTGLMQITTSTIANNTHPGAGNNQLGNSGELTISNSIINGVEGGRECSGTSSVQSLGHNLNTDGTCGDPQQTDLPFGNPGLLVLADNGGPGKTHALQPGSDAIDAGNCGDGALSKDQRGITRPQGNDCDIGAYELVVETADDETTVGTESNIDNDTEAPIATDSPIEDTENLSTGTDNSSDGIENSTGTIDNSTDDASDADDVEQPDTATNASESDNPGFNESPGSGAGSIDLLFALWALRILFLFVGRQATDKINRGRPLTNPNTI